MKYVEPDHDVLRNVSHICFSFCCARRAVTPLMGADQSATKPINGRYLQPASGNEKCFRWASQEGFEIQDPSIVDALTSKAKAMIL